MKTVKVKLYEYKELSDEAKEKALEHFADINTDYKWWKSVYSDAEDIGLKITSFELDRGSYCKGDFILDAEEVASAIIKNHGDMCETYKTASAYLKERSEVIDTAEKDEDGEFIDEYKLNNKLNEIDSEFKRSLLEDYRIMLEHEYEYLSSREAIEETIKINDYQFTFDGKIFR